MIFSAGCGEKGNDPEKSYINDIELSNFAIVYSLCESIVMLTALFEIVNSVPFTLTFSKTLTCAPASTPPKF